jgi:hypothetical protein
MVDFSHSNFGSQRQEPETAQCINILVKFPTAFKNIFKGVPEVSFLYEFRDSKILEIVDLKDNQVLGVILTEQFEKFDFTKSFNTLFSAYSHSIDSDCISKMNFEKNFTNSEFGLNDSILSNNEVSLFKLNENKSLNTKVPFPGISIPLILIFDKEKFRIQSKALANRKFKESIATNTTFNEDSSFKILKENYLIYQARNRVNFVFIENSEHLHSTIKSFVSISREKSAYTPKTKKFDVNEKSSYLKNLIQFIPGISEAIGNAIVTKYNSMTGLIEGLKDKETFCRIKITDEGCERNMPVKIYEKLYKALLSSDSEERI